MATTGDGDATTEASDYDKPAIGVVTTPTNAAVIARTLLRARRHNYAVLVGTTIDSSVESVRIAQQLGCRLVYHDVHNSEAGSVETELARAARKEGFPSIVYHRNLDERLDYEATRLALRDSDAYAVDATTELHSTTDPDSNRTLKVLVGIPAYEEANSIADVVRSATKYADAVLVVDDGSTDATAERARSAGARVVEHDRNRGYGAALQTLFGTADAWHVDSLIVLDGDGQHDADDVPRLVEAQRQTDAAIVIGSRFVESADCDVPLYRRFGLLVINALTNLSLELVRESSRISDTQSGFRAYDARAIETLADAENIADSMDASTDILHHARQHNYRIDEIGTTIRYDVGDTNSLNPFRHGIGLVRNIFRTIERERPLTILGAPGFVSVLVGVGFGYWVVTNYAQTATLPVGLTITSTVFLLAGIVACFTGVILYSLNIHLEREIK